MFGTLFLFLIVILIILGVILSFTPQQNENNKKTFETTNWENQQEQSRRENEAEKNKKWFSSQRLLTDKEIDWATERLEKNDKYVKEAKRSEAGAYLAFPNLLSEINDSSKELIFIPVNNPDFHWSLLVYEIKSQKFYHYDTLKGANYDYVKPLVVELLQHIQPTNQPNLSEYLIPKHDIRQGNGYDCGVALR